MPLILLHSSKTMRSGAPVCDDYQEPILSAQANKIASYIRTLDTDIIAQCMKVSTKVASNTQQLFADWQQEPKYGRSAIDAFIGDIYSGLQVQSLSPADRRYANDHLYILSGLYGVLRALDTIKPYRCEMAYKFPDEPYENLYEFWGNKIAQALPKAHDIINLSSVEYTRAIFPYISQVRIITPKFLTTSPQTGEPTFVTVHAKVARGAFAHWLIVNRIEDMDRLIDFTDLNYHYDATLSKPNQPVFVCSQFGGIGMSIRLT